MSVQAACLTCHSPIAALLERKFIHAAVSRGCTTCHTDHRAATSSLPRSDRPPAYLKANQPGLCLDCHPATARLADEHKGQPFQKAQCTGCHDPHSSNLPKLAPEKPHGPYGARQCASCHAAPEAGRVRPAGANTNELCYGCHEQLRERIRSAKSQHKLLGMSPRSCVECHDPHATNHEHSLRKPAQRLCEACHAGIAAGARYRHEPVGAGCVYCHDAHASERPRQLQAAVHDLCMGCHSPAAEKIMSSREPVPLFGGRVVLPARQFEKLRYLDLDPEKRTGHPLPGHPAFAAAGEGRPETNCLTCHVPHGGAIRRLLVAEQGALCFRCHKK